MTTFYKRTWAVVDLDALRFNYAQIRAHLPESVSVMAVVKADAYGHGDRMVAQTLYDAGVRAFAVSNINEALNLRRHGIDGTILILGYTPPEAAVDLVENRISQAVFSAEYALALNEICVQKGIRINCHIKLDTGMSRIGFCATPVDTAVEAIARVYHLPALCCCGLFSHFSSADAHDEDSDAYTKMQMQRFYDVRDALSKQGITFDTYHLQNSAGIAFCSSDSFNLARAGIVLYGYAPSHEPLPFPLEPVMSLYSTVSMVKQIEAGTAVSYNRTFIADHPMRIATVPIGYADGYPRLLSNKGHMIIRGKRAPIIGNICMDQLILDVTDIPDVRLGDTVTVVGTDGLEMVSFDDLAQLCQTIHYELMCLIGRRVPRVYQMQGETRTVIDYLTET